MKQLIKVRLFYKIFFVVLLSIVMSVGIVALVIGYFGYKNFNTYLTRSRLENLSWLVEKISEYYGQNGSFNALENIQMKPLARQMPEGEPERFSDIPPPMPRPPMPAPGTDMEKLTRPRFEKDRELLKSIFIDKEGRLNPDGFHRLFPFIVLADAGRNVVTGDVRFINDYVFVPVLYKNTAVGYLGMRKPPNISHPLALDFMKQMGAQMFLTSLLIISFSAVLSWFFARKVLKPVYELKDATKKLAARDFDFVPVTNSGDELGDLADNFKHMADDLKKYEQNQNRWISDISHELRTPLSVILGNIEAMQDGVRKTDGESLLVLHAEVQRIISLVNDLHEITMAESGNMRFEMRSVKVGEVLKDIVSLYAVRADEYGFGIEFVSGGCRGYVTADVARLRQIFINLIENSLKHAKSPGKILAACTEKDGNAVIVFEDTGPGVKPEHIPMLFDRLYREDSSRNRKTGGSGLGLAISKHIAERLGGNIKAMPGSIGGLKIEITLPLENYDE